MVFERFFILKPEYYKHLFDCSLLQHLNKSEKFDLMFNGSKNMTAISLEENLIIFPETFKMV